VNDWRQFLKADPTEHLLEMQGSPARYWTLVELLELPPDDPQVQAAKREIAGYPPVRELLNAQEGEGHWGRRDFYLPRTGRGTFWVLSVLGDMGLTNEEEHVRAACELLFADQRDNGAFCRRRRVPGQGIVWEQRSEPCTQARIARFLIQLGYAGDARVRRAIDWLLPIQREDGMWLCRGDEGRGCLRATLDVLRLAALDPQIAAHPGIRRAAEAVYELLMVPHMSRYHVGEAWATWEKLKYPYFGFSLVSALDTLGRLGFTLDEPNMRAGTEYLLSRQLPDGFWPMDESWSSPPMDFGQPGEPNEWLTLDAMRVVKLLYSQQ
jgi:hypothetical protein